MWVHSKSSYFSYLFSELDNIISLCLPCRGYLMWMPLSKILWSGVWRLSFWWLISEISDSAVTNCLHPNPGRWGSGEGHCTSERALGVHLPSLQIPVKIDCQQQLMALLGMLQPRLPSVRIFMPFPKITIFFASSKTLFMEEHQGPLDSFLVSLSKGVV